MHTFRHFLFLNSRRKSGDSNFCNTLKFMRSWKFSNRDIYSVAYSLQISNRNTNNSRGTDFLRAWLHSSGRRFRADMNNGSINGTSGSSSYGSGDANGDGQGLYSSMKKKPGKCKTYCVCSQRGEWHGQWWGICLTGKTVNSLQELHDKESRPVVSSGAGAGFRVAESRVGRFNPDSEVRDQHKASQPRSVNSGKVDDLKPQRLSDVTRGLSKQQWRIPMTGPFGIEVGRVLGGGLVPDLQVLNEYRQVQRFFAVNSVYNGIFGIHATAGISTSRERHVEASSETNIEPVPSPLSQIPALSSGKTKEKSSVQRKRTVQAVLKKIKQSPKKVNLVAALVRGMRVEDALLQMQVTVKRAAKTVYKVIHSARANAVHNHGLDGDRLIIDQAFVGKGLFRKTISYHAKGRSGIRVRPQCRLTVIVRELKPKEEAEIAKLRVRKFKKLSKREHRLVPHKLVETQWRWHRKPKDQAASGSTMA